MHDKASDNMFIPPVHLYPLVVSHHTRSKESPIDLWKDLLLIFKVRLQSLPLLRTKSCDVGFRIASELGDT